MSLEIVRSDAPLGAEIRGVDIAAGVGDADFARVRDALHQHSVVVIRGQRITPEQQIAFCGRLGTLEPHVLPQYLVPGYKELVRISNVLDDEGKPIGMIDAGRVWHSDGQFAERPNMYSMLYALEVPTADDGSPLGATRFVSTALAYDRLPAAMKARIAGLKAVNSLAAVYESLKRGGHAAKRAPLTEEQKREVVHPLVRTHPVTGRKCLYVSKAATLRIVGLPEEESRALIDELSESILGDDRTYDHRWQVGDLLMWDNCSSQHFAVGDYALPQRRLMHRTT
ncbi:MAG: TauD/TfdA family dioxygenase, partial [Alphaproteobacteria bacterium]|nr:TauD/TfdA family dioxygenase [Alphaproteobacteria bacterium]